MKGRTIILSPHLDDAVISCFASVIQPGALVITIFGGVPEPGTSKIWDIVCGESDSVAMVKKRIDENKIALDAVNTESKNLDFLDAQYRKDKQDISQIVKKIISITNPNDSFLAPLSASKLFNHADHRITRNVGLELLRQQRKVSFYPDSPYMRMPGVLNESYKNSLTSRVQKTLGIDEVELKVLEFSKDKAKLKKQTMMMYTTQYKMTNLMSLNELKHTLNRRYELLFIPKS